MRIFIITDSLGLPRKEVRYEKVWTDMLLNKCQEEKIIAYTRLKRALTVSEIYNEKSKISIGYLHPDLVIFQFGIVDASRRVLPLWLEEVLSQVKVGKSIWHFSGKHHYQLTALYNYHYNSPNKFRNYLRNLVEWLEQRPRHYAFIKIAPPGEFLQSKVFNIENDISLYNDILANVVGDYGPHGIVLDPYKDHSVDEYILKEDGHHLNPFGEQLVFEVVYSWILQFLI